jgi:integrase
MCELYNTDLKERFIKQYDEKTQYLYRYVLKKAKGTEEFLSEDVYQMDSLTLDKLIKSYNNASVNSVYLIVSVLRKYIDFCIENGYTQINWLVGVSGIETMKKYVSQERNKYKYITKQQLYEIQDLSENAQDIITPTLLFEGLKGYEYSEIINLTINDVNFETGVIHLNCDRTGKRDIKVTDRTLGLIKEAHNQKVYVKRNFDNSNIKVGELKIPESNLIIKIAARHGKMSKSSLITRIQKVKSEFGYPFLNITNFWVSGMINYGKELLEERKLDELGKDEYELIMKRYNVGKLWHDMRRRIGDEIHRVDNNNENGEDEN